MTRNYIVITLLLASSFMLFGAQPSRTETQEIPYSVEQKKAIKAVESIKAIREKLRNDQRFYNLQGSAPRLELEKHEAFLNNIKDVEENVLPDINRQLDEWAKTYGSTSEEQNAKYKEMFSKIPEGFNITSVGLFTETGNFATNYEDIKDKISKVSLTREACVDELLTDVNTTLRTIDAVLADYRAPIYEKSQKTLDMVLMYDPGNKQAKELIKEIEKDGKAGLAERDKQIDEGKWPGQVKNFAGPGNVDDLSEAALEWFKNDTRSKGWAEANPLLVAVKGDWISAKKNILGKTIQWGLPIYLAAHKKKDTDIVRVFSLTILTPEELGVEKEPPFTGAWVGDNFDMRLDNLPGSSGSSGGPFILWRILLSFTLIALGIVAASSKLSALHPQVKQLVDTLLPHKGMIGALAAIIGILFFGKNLLFIAPFSDLLPQLAAVLTGIILGAKIFTEKTKEMNTPEQLAGTMDKAHDLLEKNKEKLETMKAYEVPLGYACLALGLLHLIAGGTTLF